jgi:hypothetical protein
MLPLLYFAKLFIYGFGKILHGFVVLVVDNCSQKNVSVSTVINVTTLILKIISCMSEDKSSQWMNTRSLRLGDKKVQALHSPNF